MWKVINLIAKWINSPDPAEQEANNLFWDTALDNNNVLYVIDPDNVKPIGRLPMEVGHA